MKIYTKLGDKGETSLMGGKRVRKDSLRIEAYGNVDELNSVLGVCRIHNEDIFLGEIFMIVQKCLFRLGADLATPVGEKYNVPRVTDTLVLQMEQWIDAMDEKLPPLKNFILPGGCELAAHLHVARTVCRRAERSVVVLAKEENIGEMPVQFLNRLSDLLFVMARYANFLKRVDEERWTA
ncbi:cob(I)yrinic acid a,c-diamide adenosyltransferase [Candidatus Peregrinibacteria bacterium]|nr:cob(I)yrinic acid a,c-diamide adenosyltransferase [Candidatus Peregrinibacteria bacterium]